MTSSMTHPSRTASLTGGRGTPYDGAPGEWVGFSGPAWALEELEEAEAADSALEPPKGADPAATLILGLPTSGFVTVNGGCAKPLSLGLLTAAPGD